MSVRVRTVLAADGLEVVKEAIGPAEVARLEQERDRLSGAQGDGVVQVLGFDLSDDGARLRMRHAGAPLSNWRCAGAVAVARKAAQLANTLSHLHDRGMVHGRIDPSHVVVDGLGRVRLCGFAPCPPDACPEDDLLALGATFLTLLGRPPAPWHRGERRRRRQLEAILRTVSTERHRGRTQTISTAAGSEARRLAARLEAIARPGRAPSHLKPLSNSRPRSPRAARPLTIGRRSIRTLPAALCGSLVLVGVHLLLWPRDDQPRPATVRAAPRNPVPNLSAAEPLCARSDGQDVDGDGCPERVVVDGNTVTVAGRSWSVGAEGDLVVVGDWDCDGVASPAALRPSTGEVFLFGGWDDASVTATTRIPQARNLTVSRAGSCDQLDVQRASGSDAVVAVP